MDITPKTLAQWKKIFSTNLANLVNSTGLDKNEYREQAGYSNSTWHCYLRGTRIPSNPSDVEKLANVAGVNPAKLFGWDDEAAIPGGLRHLQHVELKTRQLDYKAGSMAHYDENIKGATDGLFIIKSNEQYILRRVTVRLDHQIDVSDGVQTQAYSLESFNTFAVLGKVIGITALI